MQSSNYETDKYFKIVWDILNYVACNEYKLSFDTL